MIFYFKAKNLEGEIREGKVDSPTRDHAIDTLQEKGLIPISIDQEQKIEELARAFEKVWNGVGQQELVVFYRQFSTLIEAKVSITTALKAIEEQTENKFLGSVLLDIIDDVEDGMSLSESMVKHGEIFSSLAISMIRAGEISGNLQKSIAFIADNTERNYQLNSKIKSALMYPGFVLSAAIVIGFAVFAFVLPRLTGIFKDMNVEIPWYTKMLMDSGDLMNQYWGLILILFLAAASGLYYYLHTDAGKAEFDVIKLKIPIVNKLIRLVYISRFSENMSVLLAAGIPIVKSLIIVSEIIGNGVYKGMILRAAEEVKTGGTISSVFSRYEELPPILSKMIKVGEETGKTSEVLKNVATFYDQEIDRMTRNLTALIEPILIVFLGIGVAFLVFAILMPIYNITSSIA